MSKFSKGKGKAQPEVSTASLPDIIFMLLFFFMVVTVLRESELKVSVNTPQATELTKLTRKTLVNTIYIGKPMPKYQAEYGTKPQMQLGDKISTVQDIPLFLSNHRETIPEKQRPGITTSMRVDGEVTMGIVQDIKTELRKQAQLKLNYSAKQRVD